MVMGRDSRSEGHGWTFFTFICCKNCNGVFLKRPNINKKEAGVGPFFKKKVSQIFIKGLFQASFYLFLSYEHSFVKQSIVNKIG